MTNDALAALPAKWRAEVHTIDTRGDWGKALVWAYTTLADELEALAAAPAPAPALAALEFVRDFAWRKVNCWQGFDNPTEVQANTDILQIYQLLARIAPDTSSDKERDSRADAIGERVRDGEFEQMRLALTAAPATTEPTDLHKAMLDARKQVNEQPAYLKQVSPVIRPPDNEPATEPVRCANAHVAPEKPCKPHEYDDEYCYVHTVPVQSPTGDPIPGRNLMGKFQPAESGG